MKKLLKYFLYLALGLLAAYTSALLLYKYVFTTKLSLSCSGKEVTSIYLDSMTAPVKTVDKLEGVTITITKYPFQNERLFIESQAILIVSDSKGTITTVLDDLILGNSEWKSPDAQIDRSVSFNRLTRGIEIEGIYQDFNNKTKHGVRFQGVCTEVNAI